MDKETTITASTVDAAVERFAAMSTTALIVALAEAVHADDDPHVIGLAIEIGRRIERQDLGGVQAAVAILDRGYGDDQRTRRVVRDRAAQL